eukprot:767603-Hanusia_phi.AAC.8
MQGRAANSFKAERGQGTRFLRAAIVHEEAQGLAVEEHGGSAKGQRSSEIWEAKANYVSMFRYCISSRPLVRHSFMQEIEQVQHVQDKVANIEVNRLDRSKHI